MPRHTPPHTRATATHSHIRPSAFTRRSALRPRHASCAVSGCDRARAPPAAHSHKRRHGRARGTKPLRGHSGVDQAGIARAAASASGPCTTRQPPRRGAQKSAFPHTHAREATTHVPRSRRSAALYSVTTELGDAGTMMIGIAMVPAAAAAGRAQHRSAPTAQHSAGTARTWGRDGLLRAAARLRERVLVDQPREHLLQRRRPMNNCSISSRAHAAPRAAITIKSNQIK